jgi:hypothetical protein
MHDDGITVVPLTQGKVAIIDSADAERVLARRWRIDAYGYALTGTGKGTITLHRFLMDAQPGEEVDHANRDKLDNRRSNLRFVTHAQNCVNAGLRRTNSSGFKGVTWHKRTQTWRAYIRVNGRQVHIGHFSTPEDAARAYDDAAAAEWGDFAFLNFPG